MLARVCDSFLFISQVALGLPHMTKAEGLEQSEVDALIADHARGAAGSARCQADVGYGRSEQYDSIVGLTVQQGGSLTHEEAVVYAEAAAIPSYLIVYRLPV